MRHVRKFGHLFGASAFADLEADIIRLCADPILYLSPFCLNHSDFHLDNLVRSCGTVYILDWDYASLCPHAKDLAKFLIIPVNRGVWEAREAVCAAYLEALNPPLPDRELFKRQLRLFEAGYLAHFIFDYAWRKDGSRSTNAALMRRKLMDVFQDELMRPYPALREVLPPLVLKKGLYRTSVTEENS